MACQPPVIARIISLVPKDRPGKLLDVRQIIPQANRVIEAADYGPKQDAIQHAAGRCILDLPGDEEEGNLLLREPIHVEPCIESQGRSRVDA